MRGITNADGITSKEFTLTLVAGDWVASGNAFKQELPAPGLLDTDHTIVDVSLGPDFDTASYILDEYNKIYLVRGENEKLTVYAGSEISIDITLNILIIRN